jgi:hypothetical protein
MLDEKRNDGESDEGYDSDIDSGSLGYSQGLSSPTPAGRLQNLRWRFRTLYRNQNLSQSKDTNADARAARVGRFNHNPRRTRPRRRRDSTAVSLASRHSTLSRTYSRSPASSIRTPQIQRILTLDAARVPLPPSVRSQPTSSASISSKSMAMAPPLSPRAPRTASVTSLQDLTAVGPTEWDARPPSLQIDRDITQSEVQGFPTLQPAAMRPSMNHPPARTAASQQLASRQPSVTGRSAKNKSGSAV